MIKKDRYRASRDCRADGAQQNEFGQFD